MKKLYWIILIIIASALVYYFGFVKKYSPVSVGVNLGKAESAGSKSIKITSPTGGENWIKGKRYRITWQSTGYNAVRVAIYCEDYSTGGILDVPSDPTGGSYVFNVPMNWADQYQCRTQIAENLAFISFPLIEGVNFSSSGVFSILSPEEKQPIQWFWRWW